MDERLCPFTQLKLKCWTLPCQERVKFGPSDTVVYKTAYFNPVLTQGACAIMRVSVVPGWLMLLIGKDTLQVLEARFELKNTFMGFCPGAGGILRTKCCEQAAQVTGWFPVLPESFWEFNGSLVPSKTVGPMVFSTNMMNETFCVKRLPRPRTIRDLMITS